VAQSNCAIFRLRAMLGADFGKKAFQTESNQIKEDGDLFGALILWGTRNVRTCLWLCLKEFLINLKTMWYERKQKFSILFILERIK